MNRTSWIPSAATAIAVLVVAGAVSNPVRSMALTPASGAQAALTTGLCSTTQRGATPNMAASHCVRPASSFPYSLSKVTQVAQLIGSTPKGPNAKDDPYPYSINDTTKWQLCRGDLGSLMVSQGVGYLALGDNFSDCGNGTPGPNPPVWRSNAVGIIPHPADFAKGLHITSWVSHDGKTAEEVIPSQHDAGNCEATQKQGCEVTKIPTYSFAVHGHLFLAFMSVHHWGDAGVWDVNYSSFAMSADHGKTWQVESKKIKWGPFSNFAQVAVAPDPTGRYLLFYGIPGGRFGQVELMRTPNSVAGVLNPHAYQYFTRVKGAQPQWSPNQAKAAVDTYGTVGELSVIYDPGLKQWLMTDEEWNSDLVIRSAPNYWGPWSDPNVMATQGDYPELYGAFMQPHFLANNGSTIYFVMSQFGPYRVYWMRVKLTKTR